ncbi:hypothetical protein WKI65_32070 [Streptomyces sp. MS1.AVA.3]
MDQALGTWSGLRHLCWSAAVRGVYYQQTKNLLVSYSAKKLSFF